MINNRRSYLQNALITGILWISVLSLQAQGPSTPEPERKSIGRVQHNGHSHNDYEQDVPLFKAIELGYRSIEADIHPYERKLKVAHNRTELLPRAPSLEDLYLSPLDSIIKANNGLIYPGDSSVLVLMIDLKTKKKKALRLLVRLMRRYDHLLYKRYKSRDDWAPIQILLSGDPKLSQLSFLNRPYLFIDGRFNQNYPRRLDRMVTRISGNYNAVINQLPKEEQLPVLRSYVEHCHKKGRLIRFWNTPDTEETWDTLIDNGVDWIGVDNLPQFVSYSQRR